MEVIFVGKSGFWGPFYVTNLGLSLGPKCTIWSWKIFQVLARKIHGESQTGADPERNVTRAQPKSRGCGYMDVAISMGSYKHDLADAAQLSA